MITDKYEALSYAEQKVAIADYMLQETMTEFDVRLVQDMLLTALNILEGHSNYIALLKLKTKTMPLTYKSAVNCVAIVQKLMQNLR